MVRSRVKLAARDRGGRIGLTSKGHTHCQERLAIRMPSPQRSVYPCGSQLRWTDAGGKGCAGYLVLTRSLRQ